MTDRNAILEALAKAMNGPHLPVHGDSKHTLAELRNVKWQNIGKGDRQNFLNQAAAVLELIRPKPLVWDVFECGRGAKATAWRKANYLITRWSDGRFELVESYPGYQGDNIAGAFMPTLEAAQAAAQAHADAAHWKNTKIGGE